MFWVPFMCGPRPACLLDITSFFNSPARWGSGFCIKMKKKKAQLFPKFTKQDVGRNSGTFSPCRPSISVQYAIRFFEEKGT